jgi:hypothetical protein
LEPVFRLREIQTIVFLSHKINSALPKVSPSSHTIRPGGGAGQQTVEKLFFNRERLDTGKAGDIYLFTDRKSGQKKLLHWATIGEFFQKGDLEISLVVFSSTRRYRLTVRHQAFRSLSESL